MEKYVVQNREDGLGSRIFSMINAIYLAQKLGGSIEHMKFRWAEYLFDDGDNLSFTARKQDENCNVIGVSVEKKEELFAKDFIDKHYLEKCDPKLTYRGLSKKQTRDFKTLKADWDSNQWQYFTLEISPMASLLRDIDYNEYRSFCANKAIWQIQFSEKIQKMIDKALIDAEKMGEYTCIHLRSGDAIYDHFHIRKYGKTSVYHASYLALGLELAKKEQGKVILVGDDIKSLEYLVEVIGEDRVISMGNLRDTSKYSNAELFFYDIFFISRAKVLYGTYSALIKIASIISDKVEIRSSYGSFSDSEHYQNLIHDVSLLSKTSPSQLAFMYFHLYMYGEKQGEECDILVSYLKEALKCDMDNDKYRIYIVDTFLKHQKYQEANEYIKNYLQEGRFIRHLFACNWTGVCFQECFPQFMQNECKNYPYISFVAAKICEFQGELLKSLEYALQALNLEVENQIFKDYSIEIGNKYREHLKKVETESALKKAQYHRQKALEARENWDWDHAISHYRDSVESHDEYLLEYLDFLAEIGQLEPLNDGIKKYSLEALREKVQDTQEFRALKLYLEFYCKYQGGKAANIFSLTLENSSNTAYLLDFLKTHKDMANYDEDMDAIVTYIISKIKPEDGLQLSDFDMVAFYHRAWGKSPENPIRAQFLVTCLVKLHLKEVNDIAKGLTTVSRVSDILNLGVLDGRIQQGARKYRDIISNLIEVDNLNLKPKVAVCLYGIFRGNSSKTLETIRENIVKPLDADVFIHIQDSWHIWPGYRGDPVWTNSYLTKKNRRYFPKEISDYTSLEKYFPNVLNRLKTVIELDVPVDEIKDIIKPKAIKIEKSDSFMRELEFSPEKLVYMPAPNIGQYQIVKLRYQIRQSLNICEEYAKKHGSYDYVVIARIDQAYSRFEMSDLTKLKDNEILSRMLHYGPDCARFFAGKYKAVKKLVSLYDEVIDKQDMNIFGVNYHQLPFVCEEVIWLLWGIKNGLKPVSLKKDVDIRAAVYGMIPNFYKELIRDLDSTAKAFKDREDYRRLVEMLKAGGGLFKDYTQELQLQDKNKKLELKTQEIKSLKDSLDSTKKQLESKNQILESMNKTLESKTKEIDFTLHYGTAKNRIHNHLSYKLGKAMIENSKSILGYIRMPYVLSYIKEQHNKEQKQYQEQIKKNPNLKLPKLESYKDYKESLKEKECFTYKLGEALMKADKTWYKGGYVTLMFEVGRLNRELAKKNKTAKK